MTKYFKCNDSGNVLVLESEGDIGSMQDSVKTGSYSEVTAKEAKDIAKASDERAALVRAAALAEEVAKAKQAAAQAAAIAAATANMSSDEGSRQVALAAVRTAVKTPANPEVLSVPL